jgi:DNA modification methylase
MRMTVDQFLAAMPSALGQFPATQLPQLIMTSPPYRHGDTWVDYTAWLRVVFRGLAELLVENGSMVVALGNEWHPPYQTWAPLRALEAIVHGSGLPLCQQFVIEYDHEIVSPSVEEEVRELVDSGDRAPVRHEYAWWLGKDPFVRPDAPGRPKGSVVRPTEGMPLEGELAMPETGEHPAAWPVSLPLTFIDWLTEPGDLVFDPFAGSNATGKAAEVHGRSWLSLEPDHRWGDE